MGIGSIKKLLVCAAAILGFFALSSSAKADDIGTYSLSGVTFIGGGSASGSFTYDFTTSSYTAIALTTDDIPGVIDQTFALTGANGLVANDFGYPTGFCAACDPGTGTYDEFTFNNGTDELWLVLSLPAMTPGPNALVPDALDPTGIPLDAESDLGYDCLNTGSSDTTGCYSAAAIGAGTANATIAVSTPEPSTLIPLLLGCFGVLAFYSFRRKTALIGPNQA
jgi:hypothetical protein